MVVDDDAVSRRVLCDALAAAGMATDAHASGESALAMLDATVPPLILLDLLMPQPDGYALLAHVRNVPRLRDIPVVVLTAVESDEEVARAFEAGADDFLRKPFKPLELVARVRGQLRLRGVLDELATKERDAQLVLELTQALASNLDFRGILFTVVQRLAQVVNVHRVSIVLVREQSNTGYVVAASDNENLRDLPIDLGRYPEILATCVTGQALVIHDATTDPTFELARIDGQLPTAFLSHAILPILYDGKPMGVLFLRARHPRAFSERQVALCRTVSSAMAIALRNARIMQTLRDQTQQVTVARFEAERRLRSLQKYADFFESSADGIVVVDGDGGLLFSNPRARAILGVADGELDGRKLAEIAQPSQRLIVDGLMGGFERGEFPQSVDLQVKRGAETSTAEWCVLSVNFRPVAREEGVVLATFRDVTQERAVEAELLKTKHSLERVIDSSADAIVSCDDVGAVVLFNRAAERLFQRTANAVVGQAVDVLYPDGHAALIMQAIRDGGGRVEALRTEVLDGAERRIPVSLTGTLLLDGKLELGSVGVYTDLREKMRMEQKLAQAQEQLIEREREAIVAELAGTAAHELNQPLQVVMAHAHMLKVKLASDSPLQDTASLLVTQAERMAEIVRKIGRITHYETKTYVGTQRILDLDRASTDTDRKGCA
jgi:PAS domain S-box-containing protein